MFVKLLIKSQTQNVLDNSIYRTQTCLIQYERSIFNYTGSFFRTLLLATCIYNRTTSNIYMYRQYKEQLKLSSYKLVSYNALGPGELPRLIFAQAGQEFTDERVNFKDWEKIKPTTPLGQLPVLVVDGETIPQTMAIVRFLATRFGLMGKSDIENAKIDAILDTCTAYLAIMTGLATEKNEAMKKIKMDKVVKEISPAVHTYFESIIKANSKSEWTIGDKLTVADLAIYDYLFRPMKKGPKILDSFPCIQRIGGKVEALPNIAKWIKNRPPSEF